jgi:hypothetical protein
MGPLGLHVPRPDRNPVSTWVSKGLDSTESKETLVVTSAQAKVGGEGGAELTLFGWASLATFWNSDLRAGTALLLGAHGYDA